MIRKKGLSILRYDSAAEYARECGLHRTTIVEYIKKGILKSCKKESKYERYRLYINQNPSPQNFKKPYPKHSKKYSDAEIHVLMVNKGKPAKVVAKMIGRNANSVRIKRHYLRKLGYQV